MNRISQLFQEKSKDILSVYFCAGDPSLSLTIPTLEALQERGIDMVEIGIPYSDPVADGAVIQAAASRALRNGTTLVRLFGELKDVRQRIHIPLVIMGYFNSVLRYGVERFFAQCQQCGIDACIIPDLPLEEFERWYRPMAERYGIEMIYLITPETSEKRIRQIDAASNAFIYVVSSAAVTGAQQAFDDKRVAYFSRIASLQLSTPCLVGFGISNKATRSVADAHLSGVVVGSKFVELLHSTQNPQQAVAQLLEALQN